MRSVPDLTAMWSLVRDPWGTPGRRLRFAVLAEDAMPFPHVVEIDVEDHPDADRIAMIVGIMADMVADVAPGGTLAVLVERPGSTTVTDVDRACLSELLRHLDATDTKHWPIHLGNDESIAPTPVAELIG